MVAGQPGRAWHRSAQPLIAPPARSARRFVDHPRAFAELGCLEEPRMEAQRQAAVLASGQRGRWSRPDCSGVAPRAPGRHSLPGRFQSFEAAKRGRHRHPRLPGRTRWSSARNRHLAERRSRSSRRGCPMSYRETPGCSSLLRRGPARDGSPWCSRLRWRFHVVKESSRSRIARSLAS